MYAPIKFALNETPDTFDANYLGAICFFPNIAQYFASTDAMRNANAWCVARFVINKSGSTLAKGLRVLHNNDATYCPGIAVAGAAGADVTFAGVVCPFITASTVASNSGFWLITQGFTKVGYDGSASISIRDNLSGAASGWFDKAVATYTDTGWVLGSSLESKTSGSAGDLFSAFIKLPF